MHDKHSHTPSACPPTTRSHAASAPISTYCCLLAAASCGRQATHSARISAEETPSTLEGHLMKRISLQVQLLCTYLGTTFECSVRQACLFIEQRWLK